MVAVIPFLVVSRNRKKFEFAKKMIMCVGNSMEGWPDKELSSELSILYC